MKKCGSLVGLCLDVVPCPVRAIPSLSRRPVLAAWTPRHKGLWRGGEHHASTLYRSIQAEGCPGSLATITHWVHQDVADPRSHPTGGERARLSHMVRTPVGSPLAEGRPSFDPIPGDPGPPRGLYLSPPVSHRIARCARPNRLAAGGRVQWGSGIWAPSRPPPPGSDGCAGGHYGSVEPRAGGRIPSQA